MSKHAKGYGFVTKEELEHFAPLEADEVCGQTDLGPKRYLQLRSLTVEVYLAPCEDKEVIKFMVNGIGGKYRDQSRDAKRFTTLDDRFEGNESAMSPEDIILDAMSDPTTGFIDHLRTLDDPALVDVLRCLLDRLTPDEIAGKLHLQKDRQIYTKISRIRREWRRFNYEN